ncbi:CARDB domain-containing protein [Ferruginibacter profundus]
MKRYFFLAFLVINVIEAKTQIKISTITPKQALPASGAAKQPISKINLNPAKDLTVLIDSVVDNSTNTNTDVKVYFSVANTGIADIDIKGITIQSYLDGAPLGGFVLIASLFNNSSSVIHSGEKWNDRVYSTVFPYKVTRMNISNPLQPLIVNRTYNYSIKADANNLIAETNEGNNTASVSIAGRFVPKTKDLAIAGLKVEYNAVNKEYGVSCAIGNIGTTNIDLNALKYWDCVNGGGYVGYAVPIILGNVTQASCGASVCGFSVRLNINFPSNIISPGQVFTASGVAYGYHGACGGPLVFTYVLDPDNKTGDQDLSNNSVILSILQP